MKTEHVNAIVGFVRRLQPADLLLPAGALVVSAGLQRLVDREREQRRRLVALNELVDDHRQTLEANGVELPVDRFGDEVHPLDIDGALELILARAPSEPAPAPAEVRPAPAPAEVRPRSWRRRSLVLGLLSVGGIAAAAVWGKSAGYLDAFADLAGARQRVREAATLPAPNVPGGDRCGVCGAATAWNRADQVWMHAEGYEGEFHPVKPVFPETVNESNAPEPVLETEVPEHNPVNEGPAEPTSLEACGWPGCDWTSQAGRSALSQTTAAAVHRNRCFYRPATAVVPE